MLSSASLLLILAAAPCIEAHDGDATRSGPGISPPKSVLPRRTRARSRSRSRPRFASLQQVNLARAEAAWDLGGGREAKDLSQSAVVVIDMQNDFAHPDGTFAQTFKTPGHLDMVEEINKVLALDWGLRVFTADNHPDNHVSFQTSTPTSKQDKKIENAGFDIVPLTYTKAAANHLAMLCDADYSATYAKAAAGACTGDGDIKVMQETYPVHCIQYYGVGTIQGTWGQRIVDGLRFSYNEPDDHLILKGQNAHIDSYSAIFNNLACAGDGTVETVSDKIGAVNVTVAKTTPCIPQGDIYPQDTNLPDLLRLSKIKHVYFVGLCLDYCVKYSAIHSAFLGRLAKFDWKTYVIQDLTRSCSPTKFHPEEAMQQITAQGVQFVQMSDVK